ncbi:hypothetical protein K431DRAFT_286833 [Polychaeton citri CBS 116435]|uniref:Ribosomal protein S8 n=1 Tax=Polychaeton citri CBS 116435 TaxID=1314669 RepID=A0A9P4Q7F6_9PEZI|nr:hypothetical protein K431DRAFT_286833 [Polychaeton citri CBS 116435]
MSLVHLASVCSHLQNASLARLAVTSIPYTRLHLSLSLLLQRQGFFSEVKLAGANPPASLFPPGLGDNHHITSHPHSDRSAVTREAALSAFVLPRKDNLKRSSAGPPEADVEKIRRELIARGVSQEDLEWAERYRHMTPYQLETEGVPLETPMGLAVDSQPVSLIREEFQDPDEYETEGVVTQANRASRRLWLGLKYWQGQPVLRKAKMVSKPTKRIWLDTHELGRIVRGHEAAQVQGMTRIGEMLAVSTDRGILEARECVERKIGGQPLCRVW